MKTLDRYIIRLFLINFAILFVVLMALFVVVDLIVDLDEFIQAGQFWGRQQLVAEALEGLDADPYLVTAAIADRATAAELADRFALDPVLAQTLIRDTEPGGLRAFVGGIVMVADFYGPVIVLLYVFFSGLLVTAAMGFTLTAMQRARELTAIVAGGVSLYRVAAPVLVVGIGLNALTLPLQEWVIPAVAAKLARSKSEVEHRTIENFEVYYANDESGNLISADEFDPLTNTLTRVTIVDRTPEGVTERLITASEATWDDDRSGWALSPDGKAVAAPGESVMFGPAQPARFIETQLSPQVLLARQANNYPRLLPLSELQAMQNNDALKPAQQASITQIIWSRFSLLVLNVLILVMGLPFFLVRVPQNALIQSMKAAGVCLGAWGGGLVTLQVSGGYLNPVAAAWLPVVVYLPVSAVLLQLVKT